jgi:uncharacterized membrane protein
VAHRLGQPIPLRTQRLLAIVATALGAATLAGLVALWPRGPLPEVTGGLSFVSEVIDADVEAVADVPCQGRPEGGVTCLSVTYRILEGPDSGDAFTQELLRSPGVPELEPGDQVMLALDPQAEDEAFRYRLVDRRRTWPLVSLALLFAAAVVVLGRLRGLAALAGLAASLAVLLWFVLPAVLTGRSPFLVALVGAATIAFLALYLSHGPTVMTTVALLGTLGALALTAVLASVFVGFAELTGFATEEATVVRVGTGTIDLAGILLGGVVIGALGAIDDMTVTQASAVWELRATNPSLSRGSLVRSGMRIGRDHVASTVNTLALAYAGASMPILLLLILSRQSPGTILNGEVIATEIVRALVGSIGLVAAVPLTTWLAAWVAGPPSTANATARERANGLRDDGSR